MKSVGKPYLGVIFAAFVIALAVKEAVPERAAAAQAQKPGSSVPVFQVDPFWPKQLPNNWIIGDVPSLAVDARDHIWVLHRPKTLTADETAAAQKPPTAECCLAAPPIIEFDAEGNLIQAWGGPGAGYDWPVREHGLRVDHKDNVWIGGEDAGHVLLKFTRAGKFLLQIGQLGKTGGSNDTKLLGNPSATDFDPGTNEVFISDGERDGNHRVLVLDADTGAYKRHWGAYGQKPDDGPVVGHDPNGPAPKQFGNVHCLRIAKDGLVYVCDRDRNRIQVFRKDGTFVKEVFVAKQTLGIGTTWDLDFSPDAEQQYLYVADGANNQIWLLRRNELQVIGSFGHSGRSAGQFHWVHGMAVDSKGNIYTGEVGGGKRVQKFVSKGVSKPNQ